MLEMILDGEEENETFVSVLADDDENFQANDVIQNAIPVVPLRNTVLFPGVVLPISVGRDKSLRAIKEANNGNKYIAIFSQKDGEIEDPTFEELSKIGTLAKILRVIKLPDNSSTVLIQGKRKIEIEEEITLSPIMTAKVSVLEEKEIVPEEIEATMNAIRETAKNIIAISPNIPREAENMLQNMDKPAFLVHFIASNINLSTEEKQALLSEENFKARAEKLLEFLYREHQFVTLKNKIHSKVKGDLDKQQRDYFLHQQIKSIQEELGNDSPEKEIDRLVEKAKDIKLSAHAREVFDKEIQKLKRTNPASPDYTVSINYVDVLLDLPWETYTEDNLDIEHAEDVLNNDHHGMKKIKERILQYLAVIKLKGNLKSPILCLSGPPGVGKTSLGKSIAKALGRKYVRMSLGGLHDESEIRGHRKTYIGAMPGRILQNLKKVKSSNPVFILDEIDKLGKDFRGDPSSALLEVLDPEQNSTFYDNYLETEYDLSKVLFIATANYLQNIQPALRDRMEIIQLDGYSVEEKLEIAKKHLVEKQATEHGLTAKDIKISDTVLTSLIESYTSESGVRELDRVLASVMRYRAMQIASNKKSSSEIKLEQVEEILGATKYDKTMYAEDNPAGVAIGLAYTQVGGDILFIEASASKGKGGLTLTGNLGDVMKESASTALSFLKAHAEDFGINSDVFEQQNIHIHVPEGGIPKDGPSAGVTLLTAISSLMTGRKVKKKLGMTGEITLRGKVLPVGGIKEKLLAAKRAGLKEIILCAKNEKDVLQIEKDFLKGLKFHYVSEMYEVLDLALEKKKGK